jgi:hypothetical protein
MPALAEIQMIDLDKNSELAKTEYLARRLEIEKRVRYYDGDHKKWIVDAETNAPVAENVTVNVSGKVVDQTVSMLMGKSPKIATGDETIDALIEEIADANLDDVFYHDLAEAGALAGHVFVKFSPDEEKKVRWILQDAALVTVYWPPSDGKRAIGYKIEWSEGKTDYRQDILFQAERMSWIILDLKKEGTGKWERTKEDTIWPYIFPPIVDWQNLPNYKSYYGKSDLKLVEMNDSINFSASNINLILKYHAHPKTIATGVSAEKITETAVDGLWTVENEAAKIYNLEMQSDLASSMNYLEFLRAEFFSEQRAVDVASMKDRIGQLTNFGLRTLFLDALAKNSTKQLLYGYGLKELIYRSLVILSVPVDAKAINVTFYDPMPENKTETAQEAKTENEAGFISHQTGSEMLGHDWETEKARLADEKKNSTTDLGTTVMDMLRNADPGSVA